MYKPNENSFINLCLKGEVLPEEVDDFVDKWHEIDQGVTLYQFLGMTKHEYHLWVHEPDILPHIITARHSNCSIDEIEAQTPALAMAARADSPEKAHILMHWLSENSGE